MPSVDLRNIFSTAIENKTRPSKSWSAHLSRISFLLSQKFREPTGPPYTFIQQWCNDWSIKIHGLSMAKSIICILSKSTWTTLDPCDLVDCLICFIVIFKGKCTIHGSYRNMIAHFFHQNKKLYAKSGGGNGAYLSPRMFFCRKKRHLTNVCMDKTNKTVTQNLTKNKTPVEKAYVNLYIFNTHGIHLWCLDPYICHNKPNQSCHLPVNIQ